MSAEATSNTGAQSGAASSPSGQWIAQRAQTLFAEFSDELWRQADRRFFWLFLFQWLGGVAIASIWSPKIWEGTLQSVHAHLWIIIGIAAAIVALPMALTRWLPGRALTRQAVAMSQMLFGALLIHLMGGRTETHFHVFGSLAFLALYRDWKVIATATIVIVADYAARTYHWPPALFGPGSGSLPRILEFAGWVIFEDIFLLMSIALSRREMHRHGVDQARLEALMNIAINDSRQEAETIMASVNQGLFLLGSNFRIGANYSKALETILVSDALQNQDFLQLLRRIVPEGVFATAKDYLALMFDVKKREKQLTKLNPLTEVEVTLTAPDGAFISKHLEFRFNRVLREGKISHLLVAVSDATDRISLQKKLKENEEGKQKQLDLLISVLHVEPAALQEFIKTTQTALDAANAALKEENALYEEGGSVAAFRRKLEYVFRQTHAIKGNASLLQLEYFENRAHDIEDKIVALQKRPTLSGEDFLPIVLAQSDLATDLQAIAMLIERLITMHRSFSPKRNGHVTDLTPVHGKNGHNRDQVLESAATLVNSLSLKLGKEATFVCDHFDGAAIPGKHRELFKEILAQLVRNSLTHGIEEPGERVSLSKEPTGRIELLLPKKPSDESFEFVFRDDGRGLNSHRLQSKAVELGIVSQDEVTHWDSSQLASLIFAPGFSTASETTTDAGRGIGMDIIKTRVVDELGGEIRINSEPGEFCEFHIILPN